MCGCIVPSTFSKYGILYIAIIMTLGLVFGVIAQLAFAVGLTLINQVVFDDGQQFVKSSLVLFLAGAFSLPILGYVFISTPQYFMDIDRKGFILILIGSLFLLVIGEYFFIKGAALSSVTSMSLTALAFPVVAVIAEYVASVIFGYKMQAIEIKHIVGFAFIAVGFVVYTVD